MRSYDKLKELRDETIFQIKTALRSRKLHEDLYNHKIKEGKDHEQCSNALNLENALTLDYLLQELCRLYEIK